jgi:uncharacterized cupin superfamily protein
MADDVRNWVMNPSEVEASTDSTYPAQFLDKVRGRKKRRLGKHAGLTNLSVLMVELPPGVATSLRMWQTNEDEFAYVLAGEATLITDTGEVVMRAGQSVGFPAGRAVGHHFVNRSQSLVRILEVASIAPAGNESIYTEDDLLLVPSADGNGRVFVNRRREPY